VTKVKTENELKDFLIGFDEVLPSFDVQQLHWAPDICIFCFLKFDFGEFLNPMEIGNLGV